MAKPKLRSNFQPGSSLWAVRRAQWRALGLSDEDMEKPKIAVVNSSSDLAICFSHLDDVAATVKEAVRAGGGLPFEIRTTAPSDFIFCAGGGGGYILSSRDLIVNDIEVAVEGAQLDGMICLSSCDKTPPAHLMAAARLNLPTILVACGYQPSGEYRGEPMDIEEVFIRSADALRGTISTEEIGAMADNAVRGPGVCSGMGTANSMHVVAEALGMTLPGGAPVLANSPKMVEYARESGARIVDMVLADLRPRSILTEGAFRNAVAAVLASSGSINTVKHLQASATEGELDIDVFALFEELSDTVPMLSAVRPNGDKSIEEFEAAGGARAILKRLEPLLDREALTVTGKPVGDNLAGVVPVGDEVIRPLDKPVTTEAPIVIMRGSLAPESAIVKLGAREASRRRRFTGPAVVCGAGNDAMSAITKGKVKAGDVLVVRGGGLKGGPGMAGRASMVAFLLYSAGLENEVAIVTDGQLSGLVNKGLVVGEIAPESAVGGPLGLVRDGDLISIDVDARTVDLDVPEEEIAARRASEGEPRLPEARGYLALYQRSVGPMSKGAVLGGDAVNRA
ncbi:dihydroxy-acid dehydratase [Prauserella marina]|uniref:Dihydroxy-acid dehydratase n=1 Tax=Prauserella marina TaxID=530584 RepID=A0A222VU21_9PSEU|nr:dihydroxy-acid dehydratase [Prauserella marina]ASR37408.1 dihydroxy-acid dehydratase [Prauserella marina]PWV74716.1 dihydroxyacid dehydratase [Prauserella marina]SDD42571.1 dihydroxy-acid dehydratase [Prauserella marina]